jgi:Flp pilus assembly CpaF family ATPase
MDQDPLLGRQRDRATRPEHDPTKPVQEKDNTIYLPEQMYTQWPKILEQSRLEINALMGQPEYSREKLENPHTFHSVAAKLIERYMREWEIRREQVNDLIGHLYSEFFGYGSLGQYLRDTTVEDILLNNYTWMDVVRNGIKTAVQPTPFHSDAEVRAWLQTIVFNPVGKEFNRSNPSENAILKDGSRVFAFTQPISPFTGFAIRRHRKEVFQTVEDYQATGIAPKIFFDSLQEWVHGARNMVIAGSTGSGKTTMINVAASLVPHEERLVTLEDTAELQIRHPRVLPLIVYEHGARAAEAGEKDIPMRDLLRYSLRLKPDRIIVGETRDQEAFDMLDALNTGHAGSFTSLHSNSTIDAITRLQTMAIRASVDYPLSALQDLIASVIDLVVHIKSFEGQRRIVAVDQVLYRHHYIEFESLDHVRHMYDNLGMRSLWAWNKEAREIRKINDFLPPDHE